MSIDLFGKTLRGALLLRLICLAVLLKYKKKCDPKENMCDVNFNLNNVYVYSAKTEPQSPQGENCVI